MIELLALPILGAAGYALYWRALVASAGRARMLQPCGSVLTDPVHGCDRTGYGTLAGRFKDFPVEVRLFSESLAFRRLPQLWLSVSVHRPTGLSETLDVLRRVAGAEFYAPGPELSARYPVPCGWPGETLVRGSRGASDLLGRVDAPIAEILAEPRVKEVLLTPRGVRIVSQLCQGERGAYLLMRENRFPVPHVGPELLQPLLAQATNLAQHLNDQGAAHEPDDARARTAA
ncbi:hypothetical protein [Methylobacterium fujisawaense]|uniref:hypothetical protein n=1 Tax=Methylobacterium fujisawaense TaxID=107400 RepID=UPI00313D8516